MPVSFGGLVKNHWKEINVLAVIQCTTVHVSASTFLLLAK